MKKQNGAGFGAYFYVFNRGGPQNRTDFSTFANIYVGVGFMMVYMFLMSNLGGLSMPVTVLFGVCFGLSAYISSFVVQRSPSLYNLIPVDRRLKTLYYFITVILCALLGILVFALFFGIIFLIVWIASVSSGGAQAAQAEAATVPYVGAAGNILGAGIMLAVVGLALVIVFIKRRWLKNLLVLASPAAVYLPLKIFSAVQKMPYGSLFSSVGLSGGHLVFVIIFTVASVGVFACGIVRAALYMRPAKY